MKNLVLSFSLLSAFALPVASRADTLYTVTNGILTSPYLGTNPVGTYSGTFTLSSNNFTVTSGSFTTNVNGITYAPLTFTPPPYNGSGYATFFDVAGDNLNFQLITTSGNTVTLCTVALCGTGDTLFDTVLPNNGMYNFSANGGTLNGSPVNPATTPEPSSLLLLGTGALGVASALRRRRP